MVRKDQASRDTGIDAIQWLSSLLRPIALPRFEFDLTASYLTTWNWNAVQLHDIQHQNWPTRIWAFFTMHRSGFIREAAIQRIASDRNDALVLSFLLLRLSDWVEQVRAAATFAVQDRLNEANANEWTPVLGLIHDLRARSRFDHQWIDDSVARLFLAPESRDLLRQIVSSDDRRASRWALAQVARLPDSEQTEFIRLGLASRDPLTRRGAARRAIQWIECPDRLALLESLRRDSTMDIRRDVLYADLKGPREALARRLTAALLDQHSSMRSAARFYLRDAGIPTDARAIYLEALASTAKSPLSAAIAGLGESGSSADIAALLPYLNDRRASIAAAAVRAIATIDRDNQRQLFLNLLFDPRPAVARQAVDSLSKSPDSQTTDTLRRALRDGPHPHTRQCSLRVLLRSHSYDAITDALIATNSPDPVTAQTASQFVNRFDPSRIYHAPSPVQSAAALAAIDITKTVLVSRRTKDEIRRIMTLR